MTVVLIVRVGAWENVHTGRDRGSVPGRGNRRKPSQEPKDREEYQRILLCDLNFLLRFERTLALFIQHFK